MINNLLTLRTGKVQTDAMIIDFNDFFKPISDIHTKKTQRQYQCVCEINGAC